MRAVLDRSQTGTRATEETGELADQCRGIARPLGTQEDLEPLMQRIGDARYVLLGEASHGTSDYYAWRLRISQRLIVEKGFRFIAVEGDWPDCYRLNRFVKGMPGADESARAALHGFERWPTWMWANEEVVSLAEWMREYNRTRPEELRVGFYGLDVYSLWESLDAVLRYLERVDGSAVEAARRAFRCFEPYDEDVQDYARATAGFVPRSCEHEVLEMLTSTRRAVRQVEDAGAHAGAGREERFVAEQNALVVRGAELYYRTMIRGGSSSWNVRDNHMADTLDRLMRFHGPDAKAIVWEHNTHVGDARATDMARAGMVNVGQLARERHSQEGVVLVGFAGHHGTVIASYEWGAPMQRMMVPQARPGSWEDALYRAGPGHKLLLTLDIAERVREPERALFYTTRGLRAIGVVYDPDFERFGNFVPTVLPERYDALLYLDETRALRPLHLTPHPGAEPPETYPWAV